MDLEHERRLADVENRAKSNTHRLDRLEASTEAISRLASSMEVMAEKQERVADTVDKLDGKVTALEQRPVKRAGALLDKVIWALCAGVISFVFARLGLS